MNASYAVIWCNGDARQATGRLELGTDAIELDGVADGEAVREQIPYRDLAAVSIGRERADRIGGRQTLVLDRAGSGSFRVASAAESWIVSELAERLASIHVDRADGVCRLAVAVPIREGARNKARELLRHGPPFDPEAADLERHVVLLGDSEVVFLFESVKPEAIERLFGNPDLWVATEGWKDVVAGPASVTETVFEWTRRTRSRRPALP
jgi:hypothetical protein